MTTILVIEDDARIRDNIMDTLEAEGYSVVGAPNGMVGAKLVRQALPDLVLCDIMMPVLDGFGTLRALRDDPTTADIPLIFLTALDDRDKMREGMNLGANDYISKPFKNAELLTAVRTRLKQQDIVAQKFQEQLTTLRRNIIHALPHEMRTPLQHVIGFSDMLRYDPAGLDPKQIADSAETIYRAGVRLGRLLENYLLYAQIEILSTDLADVQALRDHTMSNPREVITVNAKKLADDYARANDLVLDAQDARVSISRDDLAKIVNEIVDNAFKFSEPGTKVQLRAGRENGYYSIYVRDYGHGLTPEQIAQIGAYMQFERAVYEQQGIGLGLIITKRLADLHAGSLNIKSQPGKGTLVCVRLPSGTNE